MEYIIVSSDNEDGLIKQVNSKISEGYVPQGGIAVIRCEIDKEPYYYCQAMIKHGYLRFDVVNSKQCTNCGIWFDKVVFSPKSTAHCPNCWERIEELTRVK